MKKGKIGSLMALALAGMIALSGCNTGDTQAAGSSSDSQYTIGISQLAEHPALDDARRGFEDGLKELGVDAEIVYQNAQGDIPTSLSISQKFVSNDVDLIYAIATPAAQTAKQATSDIPILFSAVTDPVQSEIVDDWESVGGNVTGTSDKAPVQSQLEMFQQLDPSIETIGIIYNTSEANSEIQIVEVEELAPQVGLKVQKIGVSSVNEMAQALDSLLNKVDALYILSDNLVASSVGLVINKLIENQMISVSAEESQVGNGILITNGLSYYELGKQTAQMAKEILVDGKSPSEVPVETANNTSKIFNEETLNALGLSLDNKALEGADKFEE